MKKTCIYTLLTVLTVLLPLSCRRASDNGDLDGFWRIDEIVYNNPDGSTTGVQPVDYFIAINLELLQLDRPVSIASETVSYQATGIISYDKNGRTLGVEFPSTRDAQLLHDFGILTNPCTFRIETLTATTLVLASNGSRIVCTRF